MLRTFMANPGLGGFGEKEAATPDAFCQIVKELVDNAVDACCSGVGGDDDGLSVIAGGAAATLAASAAAAINRRVRVVIEEYKQQQGGDQLLRVTVSDNGCGMESIQDCVGAFHSSKQGSQGANKEGSATTKTNNSSLSSSTKKARNPKPKSKTASSQMMAQQPSSSVVETHTAGRYGIGLTLCLLHAQRLVPDSCASIQSATRHHPDWTVVQAVVETDLDTIRCMPSPRLPKSAPHESGTSIGVLLPGGASAIEAWPRLAEYLARFKLSLGLTCSLEVLAPTLSRVPLFIKPSCRKSMSKRVHHNTKAKTVQEESAEPWRDGFLDEEPDAVTTARDARDAAKKTKAAAQRQSKDDDLQEKRRDICEAARQFLDRPVDLSNVAYEVVQIQQQKKTDPMTKRKRGGAKDEDMPTLEVAIIVHGPGCADDDDDILDNEDLLEEGTERVFRNDEAEEDLVEAKMTLVRMVNKIPLLDGVEAVACGLVQGLATKKKLWNAFGLDVSLDMEPISRSLAPSYDVRDSDQVESLIKRGVHELLQPDRSPHRHDDEDDDGDGDRSTKDEETSHRFRMLPAKIRLGSILIIIQIHAKPSMLPLPTLSKGRLPVNEPSIDSALEVGITKCLQQLQENNPSLLLTGAGLRKAERDARYVPAIAEAIASVLLNSFRPNLARINQIAAWQANPDDDASVQAVSQSQQSDSSAAAAQVTSEVLCRSIEKRIRFVLAQPERTKRCTEPDVESVGGNSAVSERYPLNPMEIDWNLLDDDLDGDCDSDLDENTAAKMQDSGGVVTGSADKPMPAYQDPRDLLYASSDDDCDGYDNW